MTGPAVYKALPIHSNSNWKEEGCSSTNVWEKTGGRETMGQLGQDGGILGRVPLAHPPAPPYPHSPVTTSEVLTQHSLSLQLIVGAEWFL